MSHSRKESARDVGYLVLSRPVEIDGTRGPPGIHAVYGRCSERPCIFWDIKTGIQIFTLGNGAPVAVSQTSS
jgi:hypothetical protein